MEMCSRILTGAGQDLVPRMGRTSQSAEREDQRRLRDNQGGKKRMKRTNIKQRTTKKPAMKTHREAETVVCTHYWAEITIYRNGKKTCPDVARC